MTSLSAWAGENIERPGFTIELPEGVKVKTTKTPTPRGDAPGETWEVELGDDFLSFAYTEFPDAVARAVVPTEHLKNALDGSLQGSKATLRGQPKKSMMAAGDTKVPTLEAESLNGDGVALNTFLVMAGPRLYTLVFARAKDGSSLEPFLTAKRSLQLSGVTQAPAESHDPRVIETAQFSIVMPFSVQEQPSQAKGADGKLLPGREYEAEVGEAYLSFSWVDLGAGVNSLPAAKTLENALGGSMGATKGALMSKHEGSMKAGSRKVPTLEAEWSTPEHVITRARYALVGTRLYTLVFARPQHESSIKLFTAAADSFELK